MDQRAALTLYDEQVRRNPHPADPGARVEREPQLTRVVCEPGGWAGVCWSALEGQDVDRVIAEQISRFADFPAEWEWKHYSYDGPPELPDRLLAHGFRAGEPETLLAAEIAELKLEVELPPGVELELIHDAQGAEALVRMQDEVFGSGRPGMAEALAAGILSDPPAAAGLAAIAGGRPIAGGRVEFEPYCDFAGLWGGATVPQWRGQGIFRALVAWGVGLAAERGYRYVQVDAAPTSRPILERMGFLELAVTTPFTYERSLTRP